MSPPIVALVTGAGRGIGAATAIALARQRVPVVLAARSVESCMELANAIRALGSQAWAVHLDVSDPESIRDGLAEAHEFSRAAGPLGWLINNAGIAETAPLLRSRDERGEDLFEKHLRVNFHGPRRLIEALAPVMVENKYGRIVNVASSAALVGYAYSSAYVTSKHALLGYSRSAALELAKSGVHVNVVCPHYVDSPMTDQTVERIVKKTGRSVAETRAFLAAQNPGGTLITTDEVAEAVVELLRGDRNGAIAELVGGRGIRPNEETIVWRT